jgi:hypothetical protein
VADASHSERVAARGAELRALISTLAADVVEAERELSNHDSPYTRRTFVRTLLAAIEGTVHALKVETLGVSDPPPGLYTPAELAMLREKKYVVTDKGEAQEQPAFIPIDQNLRFAFHMYVRESRTSFDLDVTGVGWAAFKRPFGCVIV